MLVETERRELQGDVASLDIAAPGEGLARSKFLAVGMYDSTVRLLSLDPGEKLRALATQASAVAGDRPPLRPTCNLWLLPACWLGGWVGG
jgi:hypothetical protein